MHPYKDLMVTLLLTFPQRWTKTELISCTSYPLLCGQYWRSWKPVEKTDDQLITGNTAQESFTEKGSGKRNTWSNRQIWAWSTEWSRAKANRVFLRERTGHNKHSLQTTQEKSLHMDITRWSTLKSDWLYSLHPRWRSSIQSVKTRPGADCGSDHELLIAKFTLKLKKVGKTTRSFTYDLNKSLMIIQWKWEIDLRA